MPEADLRKGDIPFRIWAESTRRVRDRFVVELNDATNGAIVTAQSAALLGSLTAMINSLDRMETRLRQVERQDPKAFDAIVRAMTPAAEDSHE